jgi:hypothetical protein
VELRPRRISRRRSDVKMRSDVLIEEMITYSRNGRARR